ncbi:MAG TPA: sigma-54 dependent transcriptional regulator [Pyrinomonadaceae bacterium]|jgi:DNA-binding NtrC family response regulator
MIVDDDSAIRWTLGEALRSWNYQSIQAANLSEARKLFAEEEPGIALLDIDLPDGSGLDFLNEIKAHNSDAIVIMITGNVQVANTIAALRGGAHDFIGKPVRLEELRVTLRNAIETKNLRREVKQARNERAREFSFEEIIGESAPMRKAIDLARRVAESDVSAVLLQGESGAGKDVFARAIHYASERSAAPFVAINCAALPANLIESELFGHEKGAFTDAKNKKEGLFEQADGGTIFLDEIGEMDIGLQAKLLRVLEENVFRRVGGNREIPLDVRVIAASNRNLKAASETGEFRLDLFFRLSIIQIDIPPLRDRSDDVLLLAQFYIDKLSRKRGKKLKGLTPEVARIFQHYDWTGNVRELRNVIERASILEDGEFVTTEFLPFDLKGKSASATSASGATGSAANIVLPDEGIALEDVELMLAQQAMERTGGNLTRAAKLLHISRDQLRYKLKKND